MATRRVGLVISGHVQGVFFRDTARRQAQSLGLAGWVRNRHDGAVEAEVQGEEDAVQSFIRWARRGPSMARVDRVEIRDKAPDPNSLSFRIVG